MTWKKMKLKQLLEQLNQLAKERPEALEMEVFALNDNRRIEYPLLDEDDAAEIFYTDFGVVEDDAYEAIGIKFSN